MKNFRTRIERNLKLSGNEKLPQVKLSPVEVLLCRSGAVFIHGLFDWALCLSVALYSVNCAIYVIQGVGSRCCVVLYACWLGWSVSRLSLVVFIRLVTYRCHKVMLYRLAV